MMIEPWVYEVPYCDPIQAFAPLSKTPWAMLLDSAKTMEAFGRYSFIACDPFAHYTASLGQEENPFDFLEKTLARYPQTRLDELPPFQGGLAGFFGYELAHYLETLPHYPADTHQTPVMAVGLYDVVVAFDHVQSRAWVIANGYPEMSPDKRQKRAKARGEAMVAYLMDLPSLSEPEDALCARVNANFNKPQYAQMVKKVIDYIEAGDIFEANVSQCFSASMPEDLPAFDLYRRLRARNPAPFASFVHTPSTTLISASPERFIQLVDQELSTFPIKGTRPRGKTPEEDKYLADSLRYSEKDWAENTMIVDLMRNDLSRVCLPGSIEVPKLCHLESFQTVHHLVSKITARLDPAYDAVDVLRATFPGGSITGAPKIRAMEIITELEPTPRGAYCGSVGYLGFDGSMDTSISIRLFSLQNNILHFQAGGAIVYDSVPEDEYDETLDKARALRLTLLGTET